MTIINNWRELQQNYAPDLETLNSVYDFII